QQREAEVLRVLGYRGETKQALRQALDQRIGDLCDFFAVQGVVGPFNLVSVAGGICVQRGSKGWRRRGIGEQFFFEEGDDALGAALSQSSELLCTLRGVPLALECHFGGQDAGSRREGEQSGVVVEHFFKVRDGPIHIYAVPGKTTIDMVLQAAQEDRFE